MADASLQIGNGNWAVQPSLLLGYNVVSDRYNPIEITATRATAGTRTNQLGLIDSKNPNIARINYESGVGSFLLEPLRTNLITYSEQLDNVTGWGKSFINITADSTVSPSGSQDGDKIVADTTNNYHYLSKNNIIVSNGIQYSFSIFAKAAGYNYLLINTITGTSSGNAGPLIDLSNGTVIGSYNGNTYGAKVTAFPNSWYRIDLLLTTNATSLSFNFNQFPTSTIATFNGNGTSGIYLWGAQLEAGAYATSYIPTVASTVTRNADSFNKSGISDLIGQTEGTFFADIQALYNGSSYREISISDGTNTNTVRLVFNDIGTQLSAELLRGGSYIVTRGLTINQTQRNKILIRYSSTASAVYVNGTKLEEFSVNASFTSNTLNTLSSSAGNISTALFEGKINSIQIYKTALSDAECAALTT